MSLPNGKGDCFVVALHLLLDQDLPDMHLCHGMCFGQGGDAEGKWFHHAWIEWADGRLVVDKSNGANAQLFAERYYEIGKIKDVTRYTLGEATAMLARHHHYGPWPQPTDEVTHEK